jgi:hypothetical protein
MVKKLGDVLQHLRRGGCKDDVVNIQEKECKLITIEKHEERHI